MGHYNQQGPTHEALISLKGVRVGLRNPIKEGFVGKFGHEHGGVVDLNHPSLCRQALRIVDCFRAEEFPAVSRRLCVCATVPLLAGVSLIHLLLVEDNFDVVTLRAFFEILCFVARPRCAEIGEIIDQSFFTVPKLHCVKHLEKDFLSLPAETWANLEVFIQDHGEVGMGLELIKLKREDVNPNVRKEQVRDKICLYLHVRLQLPLVVVDDGCLGRGSGSICLLELPASLDHGWRCGEAPRVIKVLEDAEIIGQTLLNVMCLTALLLSNFFCGVNEGKNSYSRAEKFHLGLHKQQD